MKKKELKNLAQKIAECENIIQTSQNMKEVSDAQDQIMKLSGRVKTFEDMMILDEMIQDILKNI